MACFWLVFLTRRLLDGLIVEECPANSTRAAKNLASSGFNVRGSDTVSYEQIDWWIGLDWAVFYVPANTV